MNTFIAPVARRTIQSSLLLGAIVLGAMLPAYAEPIAADDQAKVDAYKKKLETWAANPTIVAAVKEANAKGGGMPGMNNGKWDALDENDAAVKSLQTNAAGKLLAEWDKDTSINKLYLRDEKANLLAGSNKALRYNNATATQFAACIKGTSWSDKEVKADPTTGVKSVQICVPVQDGGKPIGVMNSAVTVGN